MGVWRDVWTVALLIPQGLYAIPPGQTLPPAHYPIRPTTNGDQSFDIPEGSAMSMAGLHMLVIAIGFGTSNPV